MAARNNDPKQRAMLLNMAETWDGLGSNREEQLGRLERIAALENIDPTGR
jgi:hypothetical protein